MSDAIYLISAFVIGALLGQAQAHSDGKFQKITAKEGREEG